MSSRQVSWKRYDVARSRGRAILLELNRAGLTSFFFRRSRCSVAIDRRQAVYEIAGDAVEIIGADFGKAFAERLSPEPRGLIAQVVPECRRCLRSLATDKESLKTYSIAD